MCTSVNKPSFQRNMSDMLCVLLLLFQGSYMRPLQFTEYYKMLFWIYDRDFIGC